MTMLIPAVLALVMTGDARPEDEYALYFGAPGSVLTVEDPALPADAAELTVEFRFKTLSKSRRSAKVVSRWTPIPGSKDPDKGSFFVELGAGKVVFGVRNGAGVTKSVTGRTSWKEGTWHHVACVLGEEATVYLDGRKIGGQSVAGFGPLAATKLPLVIGPLPAPKARVQPAFDGFLANVAVWTVAPDGDAIKGGLDISITGREEGLQVFFPLRGAAPAERLKSRSRSRAEGVLSPGLARTGWTRTPLWTDPKPDRPFLHLFGYDLAGAVGPSRRAILVGNEGGGQPGILWQELEGGKVHVTWIDPLLSGHRTVDLESIDNATLAAGTSDSKGNVYTLMIEDAGRDRSESTALKAKAFLSDPGGKVLRQTDVDMGKDAFNVYSYGGRWRGSMAWGKAGVCLILPRTMYQSPDGLRHQAAVAAVFSPDLSRVERLGHTSSHSFGNLLTVNGAGEFIGLDLGDNYPRGVHLHRMGRGRKESRIVYTFKTAHGRTARGGSPAYPEISGNGKTFYKWSNDNATYTELGGVVEGRSCYLVVFSTDRSPEGKVLDNSRIGIRDEPRDLALVRVIKNFEKAPSGMEVSDALMAGLPRGSKAETGGFFDFGGRWRKQRVTGVTWLTKVASGEAVHAPHPVRLKDGRIRILWERTGPEGASTWALTIDEKGEPAGEAVRLGTSLTLARESVPLRLGDRIFYLTGDPKGGGLRLTFVNDD